MQESNKVLGKNVNKKSRMEVVKIVCKYSGQKLGKNVSK